MSTQTGTENVIAGAGGGGGGGGTTATTVILSLPVHPVQFGIVETHVSNFTCIQLNVESPPADGPPIMVPSVPAGSVPKRVPYPPAMAVALIFATPLT